MCVWFIFTHQFQALVAGNAQNMAGFILWDWPFFTAQVAAGLCGGLNLSFFIDPASGGALYKVQEFQGTQTGGYPQPTIYR